MKSKTISSIKWIIVIVTVFFIGVRGTVYFFESEKNYYREVYDFRELIKVMHSIGDITKLKSGIIYEDTKNEEPFNNIEEVSKSIFAQSKVKAVYNELDRIENLCKAPLKESDIKYLKDVFEKLEVYIDEFNDYIGNNKGEMYFFRKRFDSDSKKIQDIFGSSP